MFLLNISKKEALENYLKERNFLKKEEKIFSLEIPGAGNMNYVLRVITNERTFIIKQARDYVEKYPQIPAPKERVEIEAAFYEKIAAFDNIQKYMPKLLSLDKENEIMILEDLGKGTDFSFLYDLEIKLKEKEIQELLNYLNLLHQKTFSKIPLSNFENLQMRQLNYEHVFVYPFLEDNGFDLDTIQEGLQNLAMIYKKDEVFKTKVLDIGKHYLSNGNYLLHGDFYPGSWLHTSKGIQIIDTEFCFYGKREFDIGVFMAHLYLSFHDNKMIENIFENYVKLHQLKPSLVHQFMGIEIMRRLIGLAQLPLYKMDLKTKKALLSFAYQKITNS